MKPTVKDVAALAGVSPATVSRVLTAKNNVNHETRERIFKAMENLGYQYTRSQSKAVTASDNIILVITGEASSTFFTLWYRAVAPLMREAGYTLMIGYSDYASQEDESYLALAQKNHFAGAFMVTPVETEPLRKLLDAAKIPVVLVNRPLRASDQDVVCQDHYRAGYQAISHLNAHGHRRILCVLGDQQSAGDKEKLAGAQAALADSGLQDAVLEVVYAHYNAERAYKMFTDELVDLHQCTAIFCGSEKMAGGVLDAQNRLGRLIPQDVSIVCAACVQFSTHNTAVTIVQQNAVEMGKRSAELMLENIATASTHARLPRKIVLAPRLVEGESVATMPG